MEEVRWGLIGCGDIAAKRVAPALRDADFSRLTAVSRRDYSRAESFARRFGAEHWMKDWRDLAAFKEIDAVYIATPVYLHAEQAVFAAEKGKHVLCEKPMAMDVREADRMIAACRANGVKLGVSYYRHFYPAVQRIKAILDSGDIGRLVLLQSSNFENFNPAPDHPRAWLMDIRKAGGGPMMDMGCHRMEVFLNLAGPACGVTGINRNLVHPREVEDTSTAYFDFLSGAAGILVSSHAPYEPRDTLEVFGTAGSIHVPVLNEGTMTVVTAGGSRTEMHPGHSNLHQPLIQDFVGAVREDREPGVNGEAGREVTRLLDRIYGR